MQGISNRKLILGTVQMGLPYGINNVFGKITSVDSLKILDHAYECGIEILDSAEAYGNAHQVIGEFHDKNPTKKFQIITKLPHQLKGDIATKVDEYLHDLKVDHLHALLFHSFSSYKSSQNNFDALRRLKSENKIKSIGVSVYTNDEIDEVIINKEIDIIQVPFNLLDNKNLRGEILEKAKSRGKMVHTRSAFLQGLFFKDIDAPDQTVKGLKAELIYLADISKKQSVSISQLALGYCTHQNTIDNVLIGVDSISQLEDNLVAANYAIKPEIVNKINNIIVDNLDLLNPSLWKQEPS